MARILIVDDDTDVAEVIALVLGREGYETTIASSPDEARAVLAADPVDAILLDVWLKDEDGLALASILARQAPGIPFAIMSGGGPGRSLETVTARADALGATAVLFKPFDDDELLDAVAAMATPRTTG